ncbi:META domain-containing protein [Pelagerythrobacter sp.]|uniref:META domain-containing protein n=1 Tax=Pelagerythrobacter sp. TaxID=2800702 RepID=UPI0035B1E25F
MRIALALSLALLTAACVAHPAASERLTESQWRFVTIDGGSPAVPEKATLTFAEDRLSASVGCNGMGGDWRIEQGRLIAGPLMGTKMFCEGPVWEQEQAVSALLVAAPKLEWDGDRLFLNSSGHSAELERLSPEP